jgi:hypothetical protein
MKNDIDLGHDHRYEPVIYKDVVSGANIMHKKPDGSDCVGGFIAFKNRPWADQFGDSIEAWDVISEDPITLSPSVLCTQCQDHGFIQNGKWVVA